MPVHDLHGDMFCKDCAEDRKHQNVEDEMNIYKGWNPDDSPGPDDPRIKGASRRTATDDLAVPAHPGAPTIPQSVIDSTPVVHLSPATELTGYEAPGVKQSGKYTKEDFAAAGGKKPWESADSDAEDAAANEASDEDAFHPRDIFLIVNQQYSRGIVFIYHVLSMK